MATYKRINERTPSGGDYSEIIFFDKNNNQVDELIAHHCVIRECSKDGHLINETWGIMNEASDE